MQQFIEEYQDQIQGVVSGFDRLIFRGSLRRLNYGYWSYSIQATVAVGMEQYLCENKDSVQTLRRACETGQRALEEGIAETFRTTAIAGGVCAFSAGG